MRIAHRFCAHKKATKTWVIFMKTNTLKSFDSKDTALWARISVIPFMVSFVGKEDRTLRRALSEEAEGILAWLVEGAGQYLRSGLQEPECAQLYNPSYKNENDVVCRFLKDRCVMDDYEKVSRLALIKALQDYCKTHGVPILSPKEIDHKMTALRFQKKRFNDGNRWLGIRLSS